MDSAAEFRIHDYFRKTFSEVGYLSGLASECGGISSVAG